MLKKILLFLVVIIILIVVYFLVWPVPIEPVAWKAPPYAGYIGPFALNTRLHNLEVFSIGDNHVPAGQQPGSLGPFARNWGNDFYVAIVGGFAQYNIIRASDMHHVAFPVEGEILRRYKSLITILI